MTDGLRGVVIAHAALAEAMVGAAEEISGVRGALVPLSNRDCDRDTLEARVREAAGDLPAIVFVDLPNGSCFIAAMRALRSLPSIRVVTGVNLTMLLDFLFHRGLPLDEAAARAGEIGSRAIAGRSEGGR